MFSEWAKDDHGGVYGLLPWKRSLVSKDISARVWLSSRSDRRLAGLRAVWRKTRRAVPARSLSCWVSMGKWYVICDSGIFCDHVLPFLLHHGPYPWIRKEHWVFGQCGQSCGCCRSHKAGDGGAGANCEACHQGWIVSSVSCGWKESARTFARKYSRENVLCKCGTCPDEYVLCRFAWLPRWRRRV